MWVSEHFVVLFGINLKNAILCLTHNNRRYKLNNQRKVKRGGKTYIQDTTNIGKPKSSESFPPAEDNQIISEQLSEDEVKEEENTTPNSQLPTPLVTTAELIDSTNVKPTKGKQKITNPLSVGDRVKVKDNHYFGGRKELLPRFPLLILLWLLLIMTNES